MPARTFATLLPLLLSAFPAQTVAAQTTTQARAVADTTIAPLGDTAPRGKPLPLHVGGRVVTAAQGYQRQWPGTYFEGAFIGRMVDVAVGPGDVSLRVSIDGATPLAMIRPRPGLYRVSAPAAGRHRIRVDVVSESQAGATAFGGILAPAGTTPLAAPPARARRMEFIGDSHTVGYGNTSPDRTCTEAQVWETTDTAQGPAGRVAARYDADYRVNAISGRGIVRNYGGFPAATLPEAYPYALLDGKTPANDSRWHPQVIVIALGTNDFSTPLKPGEPWADRAALHAGYEARYVAFVQGLRRREPGAFFVLWATDLADGEIARQVQQVAAKLKATGETRLAVAPVTGLRFGGCHYHPDLADDARIATAIGEAIDARSDVWKRR